MLCRRRDAAFLERVPGRKVAGFRKRLICGVHDEDAHSLSFICCVHICRGIQLSCGMGRSSSLME